MNDSLVDDDSLQRQIMHGCQMQPVVTPILIYSCNYAEKISTRNTNVAFIKEHAEHVKLRHLLFHIIRTEGTVLTMQKGLN